MSHILLIHIPQLAAETTQWGIQRGEAQFSPLVASADLLGA
jgi:hypothetical protein